MSECRFCSTLDYLSDAAKVIDDKDGVVKINGQNLTNTELSELVGEIRLLTNTRIWGILTETMKNKAHELGIRQATNFDHTIFAKSMLHVVDTQQSICRAIVAEQARREKK